MNKKYIIITNEAFSEPMSKENAIKSVKEYDKKGITGYIVSEEEAKRIGTPENFNKPEWK